MLRVLGAAELQWLLGNASFLVYVWIPYRCIFFVGVVDTMALFELGESLA